MGDRLKRLVSDEVEDCCDEDVEERRRSLRRLRDRVDDETDTDDLRVLSVLGDETKHRIVRLLVSSDRGSMCVCEFDTVLDVTESAASHALSELRDTGLVEREKRGKWRYYSPTERAERLVSALDDV
ncbi:metalloregulator ArsR/SmtB family transcription factor [Haladaptatus sp. F3-133]|uniref:Metalloregulator ArsR/SmtB family transcription factor n=1 Tax=Halorutilus salinus TaxID=2487751 RepID=A0A9Q4C2R9_9EURY|nr:metalloregulator ArsR/SmtB family transcription factor [Halorutilus salinus]MCX2817991.1 metalloregulator ArsR/SmtB family transcription factor [Halorutilus salinus]